MRLKLLFVTGLVAGYVLGARSGRGTYERIKAKSTDAWEDPRVQKVVVDAQDFVKENAPIVADKVAEGAKIAGDKVAEGAKAAAEGAKVATDKVAETAKIAGNAVAEGASVAVAASKDAAGKVAETAKSVADKVTGSDDTADDDRAETTESDTAAK